MSCGTRISVCVMGVVVMAKEGGEVECRVFHVVSCPGHVQRVVSDPWLRVRSAASRPGVYNTPYTLQRLDTSAHVHL